MNGDAETAISQIAVRKRKFVSAIWQPRLADTSWHRWKIILPAWFVAAALFAGQMYVNYNNAGKPVTWFAAYGNSLVYCLLWALLTPVILYLSARFPIERSYAVRRLALHGFFSISIAIFQRAIFTLYDLYCPIIPYTPKRSFPDAVSIVVFFLFDYGILIYWVIAGVQHSISYYKKSREKELLASELESEIVCSELDALKMQIHPQFLFSTLDTISLLMHKDMRSADKMIARLGDFLRLTLESSNSGAVTLQREIDFLSCYLEIEQIRFKDRLKVEMEIEPRVIDAYVPSLILQSIVENAIQNGVASGANFGRIGISAQQNDGTLRIEVRNRTAGLTHPESMQEFGLMNARARLQQMYGSDHRLDLLQMPGGEVLVTLEIPMELS